MEVVKGLAVNLVTKAASYTISKVFSEDETPECKQKLKDKVRFSRAITDQLSKAETIRNEYLKDWFSALLAAAKVGEILLGPSSTADTTTLKRALGNLEYLTSDANTYLKLFNSEKKVAEKFEAMILENFKAQAPNVDDILGNYPIILEMQESSYMLSSHLDLSKLPSRSDGEKTQRRTLLKFVPFDEGSQDDGFFHVIPTPLEQIERAEMVGTGFTVTTTLLKKLTGAISKKQRARSSKSKRNLYKNMQALTRMGLNPEGAGSTSHATDDGLCNDLQKNSILGKCCCEPDTNKGLISTSEHSINDCMEMKGKCLCEPDTNKGLISTSEHSIVDRMKMKEKCLECENDTDKGLISIGEHFIDNH